MEIVRHKFLVRTDRDTAFEAAIRDFKRYPMHSGEDIVPAELRCCCSFEQFPKYLPLNGQRIPPVKPGGPLYGLRLQQPLQYSGFLYLCQYPHLNRHHELWIEDFVIPAVQQGVVRFVMEDERSVGDAITGNVGLYRLYQAGWEYPRVQ